MRNKKALQTALLKALTQLRRTNNKNHIHRKKIGLVKLGERGVITTSELVAHYNAQIPKHFAGLRKNELGLIMAAFAVGVLRGIALTKAEYVQKVQENFGGKILTKVF